MGKKDLADLGLQKMLAQAEVTGVGSIQVSDGQIFAFTAARLEKMLEQARQNDGPLIVFVKSGPVPDPGESS